MSVYAGQAGGHVGLMSMRAGSTETLVDRSPGVEEAFDAYRERVAVGKTQRPLAGVGSSGPNVALFDAESARSTGDVTSSRAP